MKTTVLLIWLCVALSGCSKSSAPAGPGASCEAAFDKLVALGAFGGTSYGGDALMFGMACAKLSADGLSCITDAKAVEDLSKCEPPDTKNRVSMTDAEKPAPDLTPLVDGACACKDKKCLLEYGAKHGEELRKVNPKVGEKLKCLFTLVVGKQPVATPAAK